MLAQRFSIRPAWSLILVCLSIGGASLLLAAEGELRTWSDAKGKIKIKAKLVSVENGVATLEKEDGSEVEIEVKKLSAADQKYITDSADDNPFKTKSDDPFKPKSKAGKSKPSAGKTSDDAGPSSEPKTVKPDFSSAESITLVAPGEKWEVAVPKAGEGAGFKPKTAALPSKSNFFDGIKGIAINLVAKKAAVGFISSPPGGGGPVGRVALCDLATGKGGQAVTISSGPMVPLAVHDDGRQVVMRREEFGFGNQDRLEVWTINGSKGAKNITWIPYDDVAGGPRDVMWGEFIDPETLATSSRGGKVVLWKFPEIEPVATFSLADGAVPALSPDRKLIAYCTGTEMGLVDVAKREVVAQQTLPDKLQWPYMAFSPSGKRLGCVAFDKVLVWDLASGNLERTIPGTGLHIHGAIDFPDDGFILAGGKFLFDIENQLKLWTYDGQEQTRSVNGWTFFATTDGDKKPGSLIAAHVPHSAATDLLKKALTDPSLFILKKGTTVRLNTTGIADQGQQARVQESLGKRLSAIGCQSGPNGTIELIATIEGPKERTVSFRSSGDYKMQEYISRVKFVYEGQPAWESSSTNVPFIVSVGAGENLGTVLKQREKPDYAFFERVELPKFLQKPSAGAQGPKNSLTLGQSRLTTAGIR